MICPICKTDVDMLKFTTQGTMCRDCHAKVSMVAAAPHPPGELIPQFYGTPMQTPLYWRDEITGELPAAIIHYFDFCQGHCPDETAEDLGIKPLSQRELDLICSYARHFINAPCWENNLVLSELKELRERAKTLASVESIRRWNEECMDLGWDPF
jgi:hypothetical protein